MITNKERVRIIRRVQRLVTARYKGKGRRPEFDDPTNILVISALSANPFSTDARKACKAFAKGFVDWNEVRVTNIAEIAQVITPCHLPAARAPRLKKILGGLFDHFNATSLQSIEKLEPNPIRAKMQKIEELRPDEIDNVLLLNRGVHLMPYNPHVARIFQRIGIVKKDASLSSVQALFKSAVGRDATIALYESLNTLGEKVCTPNHQKCDTCPLKNECLTGLVRRKVLPESEAQFPIVLPKKTRGTAKKKPTARKKPAAKKKPAARKKPAAKKKTTARKKTAAKKKKTAARRR